MMSVNLFLLPTFLPFENQSSVNFKIHLKFYSSGLAKELYVGSGYVKIQSFEYLQMIATPYFAKFTGRKNLLVEFLAKILARLTKEIFIMLLLFT